jgi:hypothetical protein
MRNLNIKEMKSIRGGCNAACECIDAFMDAGWGFEKAYNFCVHTMGLDPREGKDQT